MYRPWAAIIAREARIPSREACARSDVVLNGAGGGSRCSRRSIPSTMAPSPPRLGGGGQLVPPRAGAARPKASEARPPRAVGSRHRRRGFHERPEGFDELLEG